MKDKSTFDVGELICLLIVITLQYFIHIYIIRNKQILQSLVLRKKIRKKIFVPVF